MSIILSGHALKLPFYLSGHSPCPYLPNRVERKLFAFLAEDAAQNAATNARLTVSGFRRSNNVVYRPACPDCNACRPVRIPVRLFTPSRTQRRIAARNSDLGET